MQYSVIVVLILMSFTCTVAYMAVCTYLKCIHSFRIWWCYVQQWIWYQLVQSGMIPWWCNVQSMTHMRFEVNTMHDAMCSQGSGTHTWNLQYINPFLVLKIWYFNYDGAMCNNDIGAKWCIRKSDYGFPEILGYARAAGMYQYFLS